MSPSLPVPTDNVYKFACIFGLALIIVSVFSFSTIYTSSLDRKVGYGEIIIALEAKDKRSKEEEDQLALKKMLLEITRENEKAANSALSAILGVAIAISGLGAHGWYGKVQKRDDKIADLQIAKLEHEIAKLAAEIAATTGGTSPNDVTSGSLAVVTCTPAKSGEADRTKIFGGASSAAEA